MRPKLFTANVMRRAGTALLLGAFVFTLSFTALLGAPRPVLAQYTDPAWLADRQIDKVKSTMTDMLVEGAVVAIVNALDYFGTTLASGLANMIVSGCSGQKSCWDVLGDVVKNAAEGAAGEFIGSLNEAGFKQLGLDLCNPSANFGLSIQLGMMKEYQPKKPKCDINAIAKNWKDAANSLTPEQIAKSSWQGFKPGVAPLSASFALTSQLQFDVIKKAQTDAERKHADQFTGGGGFKAVEDSVTGNVLKPAGMVRDDFNREKQKQGQGNDMMKQAMTAAQIAKGSVWGALISNTVSAFSQTLVAGLWNKMVKALLSPEEAAQMANPVIWNAEGIVHPSGEEVGAVMSTKFDTPRLQEMGSFDPLSQFAICPDTGRTVDNCVIDSAFSNAARLSGAEPLTVRIAIEKNMLHGEWPLISAQDKAKNTSKDCYTSGYCESNLKKLRAARIVPIGWEIAASRSPVGKPFKLGEVVNGFNDCNGANQLDALHPYCHLIDPNWVLKQPPTKCLAQAYSNTLLSAESPTRAQVCVDRSTCLAEDDFGNCVGGYGYCTRERNVWRFNADSCPAEYNSCRVFKARKGTTAALLANTIDHGICNASNVGCTSHSTKLNAFTCTLTKDVGGADGNSICGLATGCQCIISETCQVATNERRCLLPRGNTCTLLQEKCVYGPCDCKQESSCTVEKDKKTCRVTKGLDSSTADDWLMTPSLYLNAKKVSCPATDAGCTQLYQVENSQSLNLVRNGSFEDLEDADGDGATDHAKYWSSFGKEPNTAGGYIDTTGNLATHGSNAARVSPTSGATKYTCSAGSSCASEVGCTCTGNGLPSDYACHRAKGESSCTATNRLYQENIPMRRDASYSLTAKFRKGSAFVSTGLPQIRLYGKNSRDAFVAFYTGDVSAVPSTLCKADSSSFLATGAIDAVDSTRAAINCRFAISKDLKSVTLEVIGASGIYVDEVMIEEGGGTVAYHDGYNVAEVPVVYAKVPPTWLECSGETDERTECNSYSTVCRDNEVGCERYTPLSGDPAIPAVAAPNDVCPAECVGYDVFKQEPTQFDQEKFPVYFVPSTASYCSDGEVGCSEFTNVKNETVEYYSQLRICQNSGAADREVYYSWEGSDTSGYQLKVWNLKRTISRAAWSSASSTTASPDVCINPKHDSCQLSKAYDASESNNSAASANAAGYGPCTKVTYDSSNNMVCDDAGSAAAGNGNCSLADIKGGNLDCRELYDQYGNKHYRLLSKTILITDSCFRYRITTSTKTDCDKSNGFWDAGKLECYYDTSASDGLSCTKDSVGCRSYKGNAASNKRTVLTDDFESGQGKWTNSNGDTAQVNISNESVNVGGHSLLIPQTSYAHSAARVIQKYVNPGRQYTLEFWAKGTGNMEVWFDKGLNLAKWSCYLANNCALDGGCTCDNDEVTCAVTKGQLGCLLPSSNPSWAAANPGTCKLTSSCGDNKGCPCNSGVNGQFVCTVERNNDTCSTPNKFSLIDNSLLTSIPKVQLSPEWHLYSLGPVTSTLATWTEAPVMLEFLTQGLTDVYIDNVTIKEVQDNINVVRDSWVTPASCDQTIDGAPSPLEMLGCRAYTDSKGVAGYFRSFSQLCRDKAVGCRAYANLQNTPDNPFDRTYNAVCKLTSTCSPTDGGANCVCNYVFDDPVMTGNGARQSTLADVCRVPIGEQECRFNLDGFDKYQMRANHPDEAYVPADERMYLVVGEGKQCADTSAGCREVGSPNVVYDGQCAYMTCSDNGASCGTDADCNPGSYCTDKKTQCVGGQQDGVACVTNDDCKYGNPRGYCLPVGVQKQCENADGCQCYQNSPKIFRCNLGKGENSCAYAAREGAPDKWTTVTVIDDPAKYEDQLCLEPEVGCESYQAKEGMFYFKDPGNKTCRYQEKVTYEGKERNGWFRVTSSGKALPCYPELLRNGDFYSMYKNDDGHCALSTICNDAAGCFCYAPGTSSSNSSPVCKVTRGSRGCGYEGWAGICEARYDYCEEFVDPLATSASHPKGQPYYYLSNTKLDLSSCSGQVNIKNGCVLFKKTSDTQNLFSGSATYAKSIADSGGLSATSIPPVNCDLPTRNGFCEGRCFAYESGLCQVKDPLPGDSNHKKIDPTKPCRQTSQCEAIESGSICVGDETYAGSCQQHSDCSTNLKKERCVTNNYTLWNTNATTKANFDYHEDTLGRDFTKNDTNIIIRVRPDRECAEWLACRDSETVWDKDENKWKAVCSGFGVCDENSKVGENLECSRWQDAPRNRLTLPTYTGRDVTWKGSEYAGFSVFDRYHPQLLSPVRVANKVCVGGSNDGKSCTNSNETDCPNSGVCSSNPIANTRYGIYTGKCAEGSKARCFDDSECHNSVQDYCSHKCKTDSECPLDDTGDPAACIAGQCYFAFEGGTLDATKATAKPMCRAYPSASAPYNYTVLDSSASNKGYDSATGMGLVPSESYQGANVCIKGHDCDCNYRRYSYGLGGGYNRYYSFGDAVTTDPASDFWKGVCAGGDNEGLACETSSNCPTGDSPKGTCNKVTTQAKSIGWPGFCLDRDESLSINNDPNDFACINWLPVSALSGMPDQYNNYEEAGYKTDKTLLYCQTAAGNMDMQGSCSPPASSSPTNQPNGLCFAGDGTATSTICRGAEPTTGDAGIACPSGFTCSAVCTDGTNNKKACTSDSDCPGGKCSNGAGGADQTACAIAAGADPYVRTIYPEQPLGHRHNCCDSDDGTQWAYEDMYAGSGIYKDQIAGIRVKWYDAEEGNKATPVYSFLMPADKDANTWVMGYEFSGGNVGGNGGGDATTHELGYNNTGPCYNWVMGTGDTGGTGCFATSILFNPTTNELKGWRGAWRLDYCAGANGCSVWAKIDLLLREECKDIALVSSTSAPNGARNVAWTDRLWKAGRYSGGTGYDYAHASTTTDTTATTDMTPFGAIALTPNTSEAGKIKFDADAGDFSISNQYVPPIWAMMPPLFQSESGSPYMFVKPGTGGAYVKDRGANIMGLAFSCEGGCGEPATATPSTWRALHGNAYTKGTDNISQLFAVAWNVYEHNPGNHTDLSFAEKSKVIDYAAWDQREKYARDDVGLPWIPVIRGVNTQECSSGDQGTCTEGGPGITLNNLMSGDITSDSGAGKLKVTIKYYAYANADHMPIRRRAIDYGDGSPTRYYDGLYKNHRGVTKDPAGPGYVAICGTGDTWGTSADACESQYFQETKTYVCSKQLVATLKTCEPPGSINESYPCRDASGNCTFRPRVQIMDNWGVCNGTCKGGTGGANNVCMNYNLVNPKGLGDVWSGAGPVKDGHPHDECLTTTTFFGEVESFNRISPQYKLEPWTWSANSIHVSPPVTQ